MSALDRAILEELRTLAGDDVVFWRDLLASYLKTATESVAHVRDCYERLAYEEMVRATHALKSSSGNLGAGQMYNACLELESASRANDFTRTAHLVEQLEQELERIKPELERELQAA
jgi:HPt (histidine-containing phosphotransfer) domain-containing protein